LRVRAQNDDRGAFLNHQARTLLDNRDRDEEGGGDLILRHALFQQGTNSPELIERMQGVCVACSPQERLLWLPSVMQEVSDLMCA
jgi:hypothetical protein